ncbi:ABC transporter permease [Alkaliphilus transvaalensis]|uniref:ABC transporter permease n=1 Tax=Alkaliphilus transvaalensis TaxID=114628 RepID=UPI00047C52F8|nr:ABC transporter permease [Alkaliphilus transvaalensis]
MSKQLYSNTWKYTHLLLRRDRIRVSIWILAIILITLVIAPAYTQLYPTQQDRLMAAETMNNPAIIAMLGPAYGIDNYTYGAIMAHQMLLFTAIAVAIMSILLVNRHTRGDEEEGRLEVIRSLPVGRLSNLSAAVIFLIAINLILSLLLGFGLYLTGIESLDLQGSLLYGATLGATGIFFTAITALFAQLSSTTRGTVGFSFTFLGLAYLIRAVGDVGGGALSWLSPLGWVLRAEVYVNNYWLPIFLTIGAGFAIILFALYLNSIRDLEAGFIAAKPGRKTASVFVQSPLGLGIKLQRVGIISWIIGMFILGASYGSIFGDIEGYFESSEMMREMFSYGVGFSLVDQFITVLMSVISMVGTIPALLMILKLKGEEKRNRTEHLLSRAVSRTKLLGSFLAISIIVGILVQLFAAIGLWAAGSAVMDAPLSFSTVLSSAMVYLPAMMMMVGVAVLLLGYLPQGTVFAWLYLGYSFFVVYFGKLLQVPEWMTKLTPFGYVPNLPVDEMNYVKVFALTAIAVALMLIGLIGYNRRDIQG